MPKRRIPVKQKLQRLRGKVATVAMRARWFAGRKKLRTTAELSKLPFEELLDETLFELREHRLTAEAVGSVLPVLRSQLQRLYLKPESEKRNRKIAELNALIERLNVELKGPPA